MKKSYCLIKNSLKGSLNRILANKHSCMGNRHSSKRLHNIFLDLFWEPDQLEYETVFQW